MVGYKRQGKHRNFITKFFMKKYKSITEELEKKHKKIGVSMSIINQKKMESMFFTRKLKENKICKWKITSIIKPIIEI